MEILDRSQDLDASMKFDLATSPLSNTELGEVNDAFNPKPRSEGWGFPDVFEQLLTREPEKVKVNDISQMQERLKEQGYLEPDYEVTGGWDAASQAAFKQFDRDSTDAVNSGSHGLAATVQQGLELLGQVLPVEVAQNLAGTAKGIIAQTGETVERSGALGGALEGAAIGAAVGTLGGPLAPLTSGAGALIGGAIGGTASWLSGMFSDDQSWVDALHPFNKGEWTDKKNFFEDLGFVASAASMIRGGGLAAGGLKTAPAALQQGLGTLGPITNPGYLARIIGSAKLGGTLGTGALGGIAGGARGLATGQDFGDVATQAGIGAGLGALGGGILNKTGANTLIRAGAAKYGLNRVMTNPLIKSMNKTYTGLSVAGVGGHYAGGIFSGGDTTKIEQAIKDAPRLPEWVDMTAGWVLFPERFFPVSLGEAGSAFGKALGNTDLAAYVHSLQGKKSPITGKAMSTAAAREEAKRIVTPIADIYLRTQSGIFDVTGDLMKQYGPDLAKTKVDGEKLQNQARSRVIKPILEGTEQERAAHLQDLISNSYSDPLNDRKGPMHFASYLERADVAGGGLERLPGFLDSVRAAEQLTKDARAGTLSWTEKSVGKTARRVTPPSFERQQIDAGIRTLRANLKKETNRRISDPAQKIIRNETVAKLQKEIKEQVKAKTELPKTVARKQQVTLVPARTHTEGFNGYMTQGDLHGAADTYNDLVGKLRLADKQVDKLGGVADTQILKEAGEAQTSLDNFVFGLHERGDLFTEKLMREAVAPGRKLKDSQDYALSGFLREKAKHAGRDVELTDPAAVGLLEENGYKLVSTGEDMVFLSDLEAAAATHNVGDYTKRASFFETMALSPFMHTDESIRPLNAISEETQLGQVAKEVGYPMNGRQIKTKFRTALNELNHGEGTQTNFAFVTQPGEGSVIRRSHLYKTGESQLSPSQIIKALDLDDPLYKFSNPHEVARQFRGAALRGLSYGAEASLHANDVRLLAKGLQINGLPGFSNWMRNFKMTPKWGAGLSAVAGGVIGASDGEGIKGFAEGAAIGGIAGTLATKGGAALINKAWPKKSPFVKGHDFYLTDRLFNANMAMRYALSFTFDAGRFSEQASIASAKFDLPPILAHKRYIKRTYGHEFKGGGEEAWKNATNTLDDVFGNNWMSQIDETDRRMLQRGMLGFSPREADAVYADLLRRRGMTNPQIKKAIMQISRYDSGRAGMEKTANFVFFPFSFSKKLITTMGDWALAEPARALLIHEGMRRFQASQADENFSEYFDKYMPLAEELKRINNLSFGLSPGRFFLNGLTDNKSLLGKITQGLGGVLAPSGASTALTQAAGGASDLMANLFVPVVITGEDINTLGDLFTRYFPMVREFDQYFKATMAQYTAVTEGGEPYYQQRHYLDDLKDLKQEYEPTALSLGYSSVDGFLNSDMGAPYKAEIDAQEAQLRTKYPTGFKMSQEFSQSANLDEQALLDLADNPNRSTGEEMILRIAEMESEAKNMAGTLDMSQEEVMRLFTDDIRNIGMALAGDKRFVELWDRFFGPRYGPIEMVNA